MDWTFPNSIISKCTDCELCTRYHGPVPSSGPIPASVMFIGEAPGRNEDDPKYGKQRAPFIGQAGQYLDSLLFQVGLNREAVYITNTVKCRPPGNATPRPAWTKACSHWLELEISLVKPQIIVAMGAPASRWMLGNDAGSMEHIHGKPVVLPSGCIVLPCYHPAAALHDTAFLRHVQDDFNVLRGLLSGNNVSDYYVKDEYPNPVYRVVDTPELWVKMMDEIKEVGQFAIDTETWHDNRDIWSAQISTVPGEAWFLPIASKDGGKKFNADFGATVILHNYLFDIRYLDIADNDFVDSMVQAYLLGFSQGLKELAHRLCGIDMISYSEMVRPQQRRISLDYLDKVIVKEWPKPDPVEEIKWDNKEGKVVSRMRNPQSIDRKVKRILADTVDKLDVDPYDRWRDIDSRERRVVEESLGPMPESTLADIKFEDAVQYACRDSDSTLRVKLKMDKLITELGMDFVLYTDLSILPMVYDMMHTGMAVDPNYFRMLSAQYTARMATKADELATLVGNPFNPNSSIQVATVVYEELGFKPTRQTPTGLISTDDQELKKTGHPVAKGIIEYRRLSKLKGTYADNLAEMAVPDADSIPRIHTTLKTTRVATGRLSSSDPNLQNVPIRSKDGKAIRLGFVAPCGWKLGEGDLAQIEMCTQAHLARCKELINIFLRGGDPHTETAARIFGVSLEEAAKEKYRYPTKRANFGVIYMIGARGLSDQIHEYISDLEMDGEPVEVEPWDETTCELYIKDWYTLYPEVKEYQMDMAAMARRYGYVRDIFGRIRYIPEVTCPISSVQEAGLRMAANQPVTASAQGIIKLAMTQLQRELPAMAFSDSVRFLMQIHDSLIVEYVDDPIVQRSCFNWMRTVMCEGVTLLVPVRVDFKVGYKWGEMEKLESETK